MLQARIANRARPRGDDRSQSCQRDGGRYHHFFAVILSGKNIGCLGGGHCGADYGGNGVEGVEAQGTRSIRRRSGHDDELDGREQRGSSDIGAQSIDRQAQSDGEQSTRRERIGQDAKIRGDRRGHAEIDDRQKHADQG